MPVRFATTLGIFAVTASEALRLSSASGAYQSFRREFGVERSHEDVHSRTELFHTSRAAVQRHNAKPGKSWVAAVNKFADYTEAEFHAMLGHRPVKRGHAATAPALSSFLQVGPALEVAQSVDWRQKLNASLPAKDQGVCGSCWAVASAGALEAHAAVKGGSVQLISYEQLVDCVPNPDECGGKGGCKGATAELAFKYVKEHGLVLQDAYQGGYQSESGGDGKCKTGGKPVLTSRGFVRLPANQGQPLLQAVASQGPVVVSADARNWGFYMSGVFDDCDKDAVVNHAIVLMGYGKDATLNMDFWLIRNSWGPEWGEEGYIRLHRHDDDKAYCGTDRSPLEGNACKGAPAEMEVCGMCGVLSDSSYPTGTQLSLQQSS